MGKKYSVSMEDISTMGHEMQLPIHLTCRSHPEYNKSTYVRVIYGPDTHLYDILKQIEQYISNDLHNESSLHFEIGAVSKKSFINKKVVFNNYKNKNLLKSQMQYELITNYKQKDITRKGVHIMLKIVNDNDENEYNFDEESDGEDSDNFVYSDRINRTRGPLQILSVNRNDTANNNNNNNTNHPSLQNGEEKIETEKCLDERLNELYHSSDVAFCNFADIMYNFRKKEELLYLAIDENYIENKQTSITWNMRSVLIDWLYDLQRDLELNNETLFASINYIDLFLSKCIISRQHLQLLGVTSIMIASKTYEIIPQPINEWIYLSHDQYTRKQIINLEKKLLKLINWNTFQVTPYNYIQPWLQILEIDNYSKEKFLIDLLIQSISLNKTYLETKLSKLIASIFYLTKIYLGKESTFSLNLLSMVSKYNVVESKSINNIVIVQLHQIINNLIKKGEKDSMTSAIYRKFNDKKYIQKLYHSSQQDIIDINVFQFNRIFNEYKQKYKYERKIT